MVKSKLLEFDKTLEDEVCANVLLRLHKVIDESFPTAAAASGKFSQTVVASYEKLNAVAVDPSKIPPAPPSMNILDPTSQASSSSRSSELSSNQTPQASSKPYSSPYSQQIFSSVSPDSVYVKKSKAKKSIFTSFIKTKKPKKARQKDIPTTSFTTSRSDELFSDRYLNKIARRSRSGFFSFLFKLLLFFIVVMVVAIFASGKQHEAIQFVKEFPSYYKEKLEPKLENFKSFFKSQISDTESDSTPQIKQESENKSKQKIQTQTQTQTQTRNKRETPNTKLSTSQDQAEKNTKTK